MKCFLARRDISGPWHGPIVLGHCAKAISETPCERINNWTACDGFCGYVWSHSPLWASNIWINPPPSHSNLKGLSLSLWSHSDEDAQEEYGFCSSAITSWPPHQQRGAAATFIVSSVHVDKPLHPYRSICISLSAITQSSRLHWTLSHTCRHERPRRKFVSRYILPLRRRTTSQVVLKFLFTFIENCRLSDSDASKRGDARCWRKKKTKHTHTHTPLSSPQWRGEVFSYRNWSLWLAGTDEHSESSGGDEGGFSNRIFTLYVTGSFYPSVVSVVSQPKRIACILVECVSFLIKHFCRSDFWNNLKAKSLTSVCSWRKSEHSTVFL